MGERKMSEEIKSAVENGLRAVEAKLEKAVEKYEGQLKEAGKTSEEAKAEVRVLSEEFKAQMAEVNAVLTDLAQKSSTPVQPEAKLSAGEEFVQSDAYKAFKAGDRTAMARVELKNTIVSDNTATTWFDQRPGVVPGAFLPLNVYRSLPQYRTSTDTVTLMREASITNSAAEVAEAALKPESAITFNKYNVPIETVATWLKVSKQLTQDAPAVVSYIENRLRYMVDARVDAQLLNGDGVSPNISGLRDAGNFTAYTATSGDNLVQAINRAKYQLWSAGYTADTVYVNPADWGAQEIAREDGATGAYLYGAPGTVSGLNPFGIRVVITPQMPAGQFLIGQMAVSTGVWNREGTVVEMGYADDDFTRNLITIRAETRLGLEVSVPAAILGGAFTAA